MTLNHIHTYGLPRPRRILPVVTLTILLGIAGCGSESTPPPGNGSGNPVVPAPDNTPPATVTDLRVSSPTTSSLALTWTAPGDDGHDGTADSYEFRYSGTPIDAGNWDDCEKALRHGVARPTRKKKSRGDEGGS